MKTTMKMDGIVEFFNKSSRYIYFNYFKKTLEVDISDFNFVVSSNNHDFWQNVRAKEWEQGVIKALSDELSHGDTFIDVGAWIGPHTMLAAKLVGKHGHVYAIEPDPIARKILEKNINLNKLNNVSISSIAITDISGKTKIGPRHGANFGNSLSTTQPNLMNREHFEMVESKNLLAFIRSNNIYPDLIKIDVEGGEYKIFKGATEFILQEKPKIILELHKHLLSKDEIGFIIKIINEYDNITYLWGPKECPLHPGEYIKSDDIITQCLGAINILLK